MCQFNAVCPREQRETTMTHHTNQYSLLFHCIVQSETGKLIKQI